MPPKKERRLNTAPSTAPAGFHYEGEYPQMVNGQITRRLRKDIPGTRVDVYSDLYYRVDSVINNKNVVKYFCVIEKCPLSTCGVTMVTNPSGAVILENFFKHLHSCHPDFLMECDRNLSETVVSQASISSFLAPNVTTIVAPTTQHIARQVNSSDARLFTHVCNALVNVIAHGPYPIQMLQNPAMKKLLVELGVADQNFGFPSTRTIGRRYYILCIYCIS